MDDTPERPADGTGGLTWRALTPADVPAWHALVTAMEDHDQPAERSTADDLMDELVKGSWKDPANDTLVGLDDSGTPRAVGVVQTRPGDRRVLRAFCDGGVHPRWRRRGIGTAVLRWQRARALEKLAAARNSRPGGDRLPARVLVHAEEQMQDRAALFGALGFTATRWYIDMRRPLTGPGAPPLPDEAPAQGLALVPFDPTFDEPVRTAHNEAFAEHWGSEPRTEEDWRLSMTESRELRREWSFVVLDGHEVAGYAISAAYEHEWQALGYSQGWTDILGVRPAWRRRGVAGALLSATMRAFAGSGMQYAGLGVDSENSTGALGVYERMGYAPERRSVAYVLEV